MRRVAVIIISILFILLVGCQNPVKGGVSKEPDIPQGPYTLVGETSLPKEVFDWFESFKGQRGAFVFQHPNYTYMLIAAGQKNTGGYGVVVRDFIDEGYEKRVVVEFTEPKPGAIVPQVITYPSVILKIESDSISKYSVSTTQSEGLEVKDKIILGALDEPKQGETISNPVKVKGKIAAFEGAFIIRILDGNNKIIKEESGQTEGAPKWGAFEKQISYPVPTTPNGAVEIGEYSAENGAYKMYDRVNVNFNR